MKKSMLLILCVLLLVSGLPAVSCADDDTILLRTADDWNTLALNCVLDTWSAGKTVILAEDIDFTGLEFAPVPLFSGVFRGGGHKLCGITTEQEMSPFAVFRQVMAGAVIDGLTVEAVFSMADRSDTVGGIAGINSGTITDCRFEGTVSGRKCVGGICGINEEEGSVGRCSVSGSVTGEHRAGGIAGENNGTVTGCENSGRVNASPLEITAESVEIDDNALSAEELVDITDIGGICGISSGTVLNCRNRGDIGYQHVGYNIGGITGRLSGTVIQCENSGNVAGRKDVGGIAGQLDPDTAWDFSEGNLVTLQGMLNSLQGDINVLVSDIDGSGQVLSQNIRAVVNSLNSIGNAAGDFINDVSSWGMENLAVAREQLDELMADYMEQLAFIKESMRDSDGNLPDIDIPDIFPTHEEELPDEFFSGRQEEEPLPEDSGPETPSAADEPEDIPVESSQDESGNDAYPAGIPEDGVQEDSSEENSPLVCEPVAFTGSSDFPFDIDPEDFPLIPDIISDFPEFTSNAPAVLTDALRSAMNSVESLSTVFGDEEITADIKNVSDRLFSISDYILKIANRGVSASSYDYISDISLREDGSGTGIVSGSTNSGNVSADTNAGGIVGAATIDFSFDRDDSFNLSSMLSGGAKYLIFAAVDSCANTASVSAKKSAAGGIVGRMDYGAMTRCESCGDVSSSGEYAGGAAGYCKGTIQRCSTRSRVSAARYLGGIAGYAHDISSCLAIPDFEAAGGYQGAVAGFSDGTVSQNYYSECDIGGVNGFSFAGQAEQIPYSQLVSLSGNSDIFRSVTLTFVVDGEEYTRVDVPFDNGIEELPEVPDSDGKIWKWDPFDRDGIYHSMTIEGQYVSPVTSLSSGEKIPKFIVEGVFQEGQELTVLPLDPGSVLTGEGVSVLDACTLTVGGYQDTLTVRMRESEDGNLFIGDQPAGYSRDRSYIVFSLENGGSFCYTDIGRPAFPVHAYAAGGAVILAAVLLPVIIRSGRRRRNPPEKAD